MSNKVEEQEWYKRLVQESEELKEKIEKLAEYIFSPEDTGFNNIAKIQRELLLTQFADMQKYLNTLAMRLKFIHEGEY